MTTNLVASIKQSLTPDMIAKIASLLGLDRSAAQKAIGAGVPAILASFVALAASPDGARQLSGALAQQPPGAFDRFRSAIGGGSGQATLAESGAGLMSGLIGSSGLNALAAAIGSFAGIGTQNAKALIGMLGPVVAGALGHEQRSAGLDASGLASLLASQKDQIAAAMPPGLTKTLSTAGVLDAVGGGLRRTAAAPSAAGARIAGVAGDATASASQAAYAAGGAAAPRTAPRTWPLWALGFAALAGFGLYLSGHDSSQLAERQATPATQTSATVGGRTPDIATAAELKSELNASVSAVRVAILGMTNSANANAALPQLRQAAARLDRVNAMVEELPPAARRGVANALAPTAARLNQLFDKILASPEVASVAKPAIEEVRSKLAALSRT
jgi:hypothetical protein